jgi:hypothetical protein
MVLNGWAWVLERYGPDEEYLDALEDARRNRRGIWSHQHNVHPWSHKRDKMRAARSHPVVNAPRSKICCPQQGCGGTLVPRTGRFGEFLGCSNFPRCRFSQSLEVRRL